MLAYFDDAPANNTPFIHSPSGSGILLPVQLSALYPPKNLPRSGIIPAGLWCYEYAKDYEDPDTNPYAVGEDFGQVMKPFGAPEMMWTNGDTSAIARKHLKASVQPGEDFVHDGHTYKCKKYTGKGVHLFRKKLSIKALRLLSSTKAPTTHKPAPQKTPKKRKAPIVITTPTTHKPSPQKTPKKTTAPIAITICDVQENPRWVRCKRPKLKNSEWNVLAEKISDTDIPQINEWSKKEYMPFAARVLREYRGLQKSALHLNRR